MHIEDCTHTHTHTHFYFMFECIRVHAAHSIHFVALDGGGTKEFNECLLDDGKMFCI